MPFDIKYFTMTNNNLNASPISTFESNSCGGASQPSALFAFACDFEMDTWSQGRLSICILLDNEHPHYLHSRILRKLQIMFNVALWLSHLIRWLRWLRKIHVHLKPRAPYNLHSTWQWASSLPAFKDIARIATVVQYHSHSFSQRNWQILMKVYCTVLTDPSFKA